NVINPDTVIKDFGADSLRLYEMFMGPLEQVKPWSTKGVDGVNRFLNRAWRLFIVEETGELKVSGTEPSKDQLKVLHIAIKKVTEDIEEMRFNTAISALMIFVNEANGWNSVPVSVAKDFAKLLSPFAPHFSEELWERLGESTSIAYTEWPLFNKEYIKEDEIMYPVQVNGKVRANVYVPIEKMKDKDYVLEIAKGDDKIRKYLSEGKLVKEIFVPGRIINFVVK
ncbi:MAG: class I tRNA ligase family protein, partial [Balneolales bacterium]|nr:class I tRNA ligase family protein [Balneolales bacterium]